MYHLMYMLTRLMMNPQLCTTAQRKFGLAQPGHQPTHQLEFSIIIHYDALWACFQQLPRCAAELRKKTAAGDYRQLEVADNRGVRRLFFSKELQPTATASASMQHMLTAPPRVEHAN